LIVTFLGTGTSHGIPVIGCGCEVCTSLDFRDKRLRTSIHIEVDGKSIVVDSGPDFRQQMLQTHIKKLDALLFTHEHKDHIAGLDDIRAFNFWQHKAIPVYAHKRVIDKIQKEYDYIFTEKKYPGIPEIDVKEITNTPFSIEDVTITPVEVMHYKLPVFGFRIKDFTYITDAKTISETELEKVKGSKVIVLNALQKAEHISHLNLEEAIALIEKLQPEKAYLTHMSHKMGLTRDVTRELPPHVHFAYDGLKIHL